MKKSITSFGIKKASFLILMMLVGIGSFAFAYGYSNKEENIARASQCSDTCVQLYEDKASPDTLAVIKGSSVQFNSADGRSHSLSLGEGSGEHDHMGDFNSGIFKADEGWKVQFDDEGTYLFHDHLNPKLNVLVVVYTPGKEYKVQR